ncbi:MAG: folK [Glaciihabitans sp.]|nr:folK [Glaciihabitans sp.]
MIRAERINPEKVPALAPTRIVLSLGSNLGDREATIRAAITDIIAIPGITAVAASSLVETPALKPHGVDASAPAYLNAVLVVDSIHQPLVVLDAVNCIEAEHGRVREERRGDRTLDNDLVSAGASDAGGVEINTERLQLPHPRAFERAFVLVPWLEVEPDAEFPGRGRIDALLAAITNDVRPYQAEDLL